MNRLAFSLSGLKTGTTVKKKSTDIKMLMLLVTSKQANSLYSLMISKFKKKFSFFFLMSVWSSLC